MAKELKIITAAKAAKADGYVYMTSVVKSVFSTEYHNVNKIDDVIATGKWIAAGKSDGKWHGPIGVSGAYLPDRSINKSVAIEQYCK
jgi:hypothetical protein